jgi:uncharacterized protein GlcG (DUF336 family)
MSINTQALVNSAFDVAKEHSIHSSFWLSVVNSSGFEIVSIWMPYGNSLVKSQSKDNATRKAITACSRQELTGFEVGEPNHYTNRKLSDLRENPTFTNLKGGVPLYAEVETSKNSLIGGIGISGFDPTFDLRLALLIITKTSFIVKNDWKRHMKIDD